MLKGFEMSEPKMKELFGGGRLKILPKKRVTFEEYSVCLQKRL